MPDSSDTFDTFMRREIVCPYCGHKYSDSYEYHRELGSTTRIECDECNQTFESEQVVDVTYSTSTIDHAAEAARKAREDKRIAERYAACQAFPPGTRVRVLNEPRFNARDAGRTGTVSNRELCRTNPFVHVDLDGNARPWPDSFFPDEIERE